jgi:peroxygenase
VVLLLPGDIVATWVSASDLPKPDVRSALQKHAAFFDVNGDGILRFGETRTSLRRLGLGSALSLGLASIIHAFLGPLTNGGLAFTISVERISRGRHVFDTGAFDLGGKFDGPAFECIFDATGDGLVAKPQDRVTRQELRRLIVARGRREPGSSWLVGLLANTFSWAEVKVLFCLASDCKKQVNNRSVAAFSRRRLRAFFSGTLLHALARRRRLAAWRCRTT